MELIKNITKAHEGVPIFGGVGERTREGNDRYMEMKESGVINDQNIAESKVALVYVGLTALTMAEYFRDVNEQDVLLFADNIFRSDVSALLGRISSAVGYQLTFSTEMGSLQERITSTKEGSITSIQVVYVPADYLTDVAPATTFAHLDVTTHSRSFRFNINYATTRIVVDEHYETAQHHYKELQDIIAILGLDELSEELSRLSINHFRRIRWSSQTGLYLVGYELRNGEQFEEMTLNLCVLTPNRIIWDSEVKEIILSTNSGKIGILPNHAPIATAVDIVF
ncbi:LOW QUALITY PROTEIN: hypothetical protein M8C21_005812 [Ambrosia artemisiifolia]|uniref:H(+)-transporting two-sector ATPase n=1 Tax=Ambrosia artemisiifolia TaxID=4212 RepID=A0AAD5CKJ2_AMBAR|nr:LOW QUALITY PROTEIN: hypothetical protein M8C21_005812 [Ambrosia artemisiifolia]